MNQELSSLFLTSFNNGKIIHLLDKFTEEHDDSIYNLYKGIIYLNLKDYYNASKYFYKGIQNNPGNKDIHSNLKCLPLMYQKKKYIITLEGHFHTTHSFSILFNNFSKSLRKLDNVELRLRHIPMIGLEDEYLSTDIESKNDKISDLTIRICIPNNKNIFDCSQDKNSKYTLIFIVTEGIHIRYLENLDKNVYIMTPSNFSKECFIKTQLDLNLYNKIDVIPHGVDFSNKYILDNNQLIESRAKYNIEKEFVFLNISGFSRNKNLEKIVEAFLMLPQNNIKLIIKINSHNNNFNNKLFNVTHKNIIVIKENYDDEKMNELYNICDCYISASYAEGFNMPVLEAGSYGKLVISPENSPTDEFTYNKGTIKIKSNIDPNTNFLNISVDNIFNAMDLATKMDMNTEIINETIGHHLKYNWDIIVKNLIYKYCDLNDNYQHLKKLIYYDKSLNNQYYLDKYYDSLINYNINNIIFNDFINSYDDFFLQLYLYISSKNKFNILKQVILSLSPTTLKSQLFLSINIDKILNVIPFCNNIKCEHEFINKFIINYPLEKYICLLPEVYFFSSYLSKDISKSVKYKINQRIQSVWKNNKINVLNQPKKINGKYKLCILTALANVLKNAVYKFIKYQIEILSKLFYIDIYLLDDNIEEIKEDIKTNIEMKLNIKINKLSCIEFSSDINFFYKLYSYNFKDNNNIHNYISNFDSLLNNDYLCCYIPVIGCEISTIYLSNLQIAPIQFGGYGHPISSFGSKNNYFIASKDIEKKEHVIDNYSEKLIYVDGLTTLPIYNNFNSYDTIEKEDNIILISANCKKITPDFKEIIQTICKEYYLKYKRKIFIKFFPGHSRSYNYSKHCCDKSFDSNYYHYKFIFAETIELYMKEKYNCKIALDSYPYGGFTTILENINLHIPTVVYEGYEAINNFPKYIYNFFNLNELIVTSYNQYVDLVLTLLNNNQFYNNIYQKLKSIDLTLLNKVNVKDSMLNSFNKLIEEQEDKMILKK
tara:strand:+ start:308 stop:3295 length:2988 start_codon:yes stop_codon:yes gene_type:complete